MDEKILVYLEEQEAQRFVDFQKYYVPFNTFLSAGVFREVPETIVINKKIGGKIKSIIRTDLLYSDNPNFVFIN